MVIVIVVVVRMVVVIVMVMNGRCDGRRRRRRSCSRSWSWSRSWASRYYSSSQQHQLQQQANEEEMPLRAARVYLLLMVITCKYLAGSIAEASNKHHARVNGIASSSRILSHKDSIRAHQQGQGQGGSQAQSKALHAAHFKGSTGIQMHSSIVEVPPGHQQ